MYSTSIDNFQSPSKNRKKSNLIILLVHQVGNNYSQTTPYPKVTNTFITYPSELYNDANWRTTVLTNSLILFINRVKSYNRNKQNISSLIIISIKLYL